jgi:hypothetical protein
MDNEIEETDQEYIDRLDRNSRAILWNSWKPYLVSIGQGLLCLAATQLLFATIHFVVRH